MLVLVLLTRQLHPPERISRRRRRGVPRPAPYASHEQPLPLHGFTRRLQVAVAVVATAVVVGGAAATLVAVAVTVAADTAVTLAAEVSVVTVWVDMAGGASVDTCLGAGAEAEAVVDTSTLVHRGALTLCPQVGTGSTLVETGTVTGDSVR